MLSVTYAQFHLCYMTFPSPSVLSVVKLSAVMLSVVATCRLYTLTMMKVTDLGKHSSLL
jgi:hypothetical protein